MTRIAWLAAIAFGLSVSSARAQGPVRPLTGAPNPPYSPYLNLVRPGANPAINYYGLVRPQNEFARSMQALQSQMNSTQQSLADQQATGDDLTTGHAIYFMNYGGYFMNTNAGRPAVAAPTRPGTAYGAVTPPRNRR
jgi:hypothetical protein